LTYLLTSNAVAASLYWSTGVDGKIQRYDLTLGQVEDVISGGIGQARSVALDLEFGRLYWTDSGSGSIRRANLDGTDVEDVTTGLQRPTAIAIDQSNGKVYWSDTLTNQIQRSGLDGENLETVVNDAVGTSSIIIDSPSNQFFWLDSSNQVGTIQRSDLDGGNSQVVRETDGIPTSLAIDFTNDQLYWAIFDDPDSGKAGVFTAPEGVGVPEKLSSDVTAALALALFQDRLFFSVFPGGKILRHDLITGDNEPLVSFAGILPIGLAINPLVEGDATFDLLVNNDDFQVIKNFYRQGDRRSQGDLNFDRTVDLNDLILLKANFGAQGNAAGNQVPEPSTIVLTLLGFVCLFLRPRTK